MHDIGWTEYAKDKELQTPQVLDLQSEEKARISDNLR